GRQRRPDLVVHEALAQGHARELAGSEALGEVLEPGAVAGARVEALHPRRHRAGLDQQLLGQLGGAARQQRRVAGVATGEHEHSCDLGCGVTRAAALRHRRHGSTLPGMSHGLPTQPAESFIKRRRSLGARLDGPALLFSGVARPLNYPANVLPFRPDSHFLYLTGACIEHAAVLIDGERDVLFMPPFDPDELIWHGPSPSWDEFRAATGVAEIRDIAELGRSLPERTATIPAVDATTRFRQGRLLDRSWADPGSPVELGDRDAALAD